MAKESLTPNDPVRGNPPVRSKFDKSHGKGLPAPHLKHPGQVAKETGAKHAGFTENGHMLPKEVKSSNTDRLPEKSTTLHLGPMTEKERKDGPGVLADKKL